MSEQVIIFGAGASHGSDDPQVTPPVCTGLFDALAQFDPDSWGSLAQNEAKDFQTDFEGATERYARENPDKIDTLQLKMAEYFFKFQPGPKNLYRELAKRLKKASWCGAMVTFNYERLLELALLDEGAKDQIEICLPHGCCNLFIHIILKGQISIGSRDLLFDDPPNVEPERVTDAGEFCDRIRSDRLPPVMCYFDWRKNMRTGSAFIKKQRERFAELVRAASTIVVIGLAVRRLDVHIWKPLEMAKGRLIYCSGKCASEEFDKWRYEFRPTAHDLVLPEYWESGFERIYSELQKN